MNIFYYLKGNTVKLEHLYKVLFCHKKCQKKLLKIPLLFTTPIKVPVQMDYSTFSG